MIDHAEASIHAQKKFIKDVNAMVQAVDDKKVANPYIKQQSDLVTLITREIMDPEVGRCLRNIKESGARQAEAYVQNVIETGQKALSDTIHRNNFYTFQNRPPAELNKDRKQALVQNATDIVTRYYYSIKDRPECDHDDFFKHKGIREPPTLSKKGQIYIGNESAFIDCLPGVPKPGKIL